MDNREKEILACRAELAELRRRVDVLGMRLDALENKGPVQVYPAPAAPAPIKAESPHTNGNLESAVGRNLFAVLASVLVLLGVGVFISSIYERIPEIVKIIAIYAFGFVLLGVGLAVYRKNGNKFWLGVASCGMAELLVSIITSHSYFEVLSLMGTFALVLVWIVGSFLLTKYHPTVFKTIGFVGFLISISLGLSLIARNEIGVYLTLLGAYVVLSVFFMVTNKRYVNLNTVVAFCCAGGLMMFLDMDSRLPEAWNWLAGVVAVSILALFHGIYGGKGRIHRDAYPLYSVLSVAVAAAYLSDYDSGVMIPVVGAGIFLLWFVQERWGCRRELRCVYTALAGVFLLFAAYSRMGGERPELWWFPVFTTVAYFLYWLTKRRDVAWLGLMCLAVFHYRGSIPDWVPWVSLPGAAALFALCNSKWLRQDKGLQTAWYVLLFLLAHDLQVLLQRPFLKTVTGDGLWMVYQVSDGLFFGILAAANVWYLHRAMADREKILRITVPAAVVMVLQGYVLLGCLSAVDSEIWFVSGLGILSSLLILSYSLWYTFRIRGNNRNLMVWQFIKFTLYCWIVLVLLDSPGILIHISLLVVAILAVVLGFKLNQKAVRIYGLVLSLVDVVSLVLFNIDYGNSLQLAGGIILCGVLCFVISFIYSRLSKVF